MNGGSNFNEVMRIESELKRIQRHEGICRQCGDCCRIKYIDPATKKRYITDLYCPMLDPTSHLCMFYNLRFRMKEIDRTIRCLTMAEGMAAGEFPQDCAYMKRELLYRAAKCVDAKLQDDIPEAYAILKKWSEERRQALVEVKQDILRTGRLPVNVTGFAFKYGQALTREQSKLPEGKEEDHAIQVGGTKGLHVCETPEDSKEMGRGISQPGKIAETQPETHQDRPPQPV